MKDESTLVRLFIPHPSAFILQKLHPARLERAIFAFGGRRLIHWATGAKRKDEGGGMKDENGSLHLSSFRLHPSKCARKDSNLRPSDP